ncbi:hypothetical protein VTP01DRAFT_2393 [Rhizomucor pusillus]|uniref:uncharacterized protein n=1 Tax=Rhizomucor pusillus TaxID=4840 RepID=UPI0037439C15
MTDFAEEQQNELEALQSIYPEEFQELGDKEFKIAIYPDEQDEESPCALDLHVKYTAKYPDELPEFSIQVTQGELSDAHKNRIVDALKTAGEDSLGMAMIFTMASLAKEELNLMMDDIKRIRAEAEEERIRKIEEAENAKFHGTKLTVERFMEWKAKFEKELAEKESEEKKARLKELKGKLTGRQLFEQDKSLAMSDAKYMEEGDESVDASQYEREERQQSDNEDDNPNAVWKRLSEDD